MLKAEYGWFMIQRLISLVLSGLLVAGCASTSPQARREKTDSLISKHGWQKVMLDAGYFALAGYVPQRFGAVSSRAATLTVYIEGDGFAFRARQPSEDPTPLNPLALELAIRHGEVFPDKTVAYLARPCQYVTGADALHCNDQYWATHRFSPEVIVSTNKALDQLKQRAGASSLVLVGYSGGGAVAALVAARRSDVTRLVTVAGTLDHRAWTSLHKVSPMDGSLNPADVWQKLQDIPQIHFVGAKDTIMPVAVAEAYRSRFPVAKRPEVQVVPDFDHECCWAERWSSLKAKAFPSLQN